MKPPAPDQLLTVEQTAQLLAVTPAAIRKWLVQRRLPKVKVGCLTRLRQSDVEAVIARGLAPIGGRPTAVA
jgi:excisionase family DNA binding protein